MPTFIEEGLLAIAGFSACYAGLRRRYGDLVPRISRAELERRVAFLETVPLFRTQLPKAELPRVAVAMNRTIFVGGRPLVAQGELRDEFVIIEYGEAQVLVDGELRATLSAGDFWGDGTLIRRRVSGATVIAVGGRLTALTLRRSQFERLGLHKLLNFPKRPALYNGAQKRVVRTAVPAQVRSGAYFPLPEGAVPFIVEALRTHMNTNTTSSLPPGALQTLAQRARMCKVGPGEDIARCGDFSHECFVIQSGTVEVFTQEMDGPCSADFKGAIGDLRSKYQNKKLMDMLPTASASFAPAQSESSSGMRPKRSTNSVWKSSTEALTRSITPTMVAKKTSSTPSFQDCGRGPHGILGEGDVFGEITMFYNSRYAATFRASQAEPVIVYSIMRADYKSCLASRGSGYREWVQLLNEVPALEPLFCSERREMARHASGYRRFEPGDRILENGSAWPLSFWYVLASGSAVAEFQSPPTERREHRLSIGLHRLAARRELYRGHAFGGSSILAKQEENHSFAEYSVTAGPEGMVCLVIDADVLSSCGLSWSHLEKALATPGVDEPKTPKTPRGTTPRTPAGRSPATVHSMELEGVDPSQLRSLCVLGTGAFGYVILQEEETSGTWYALKRMSKGLFDKCQREHICAEKDLMSLTDSDFIVRLISSWRDRQFLYMLQEATLGGSLLSALRKNASLFKDAKAARFYVACVTAALEHLHTRSIIHRDVKAENVLLDSSGYAKLCDMGFARFVLGKTYTCCGTPEYMAPEVLNITGHTFSADWWSLGVLACELLTGNTPWEVSCVNDECFDWAHMLVKSQERGIPASVLPPKFQPAAARSFVLELLQVSPHHRLGHDGGAKDIRSHRWFTSDSFDFDAFHEQELTVPWVPPKFEPRGVVPDLRWKVPISCHYDRILEDEEEVGEAATETLSFKAAVERLVEDEDAVGFSCTIADSVEDTAQVTFKATTARVKAEGWVTCVRRPELFEHYEDDGSDWDKTFALPACVILQRQARSHAKSELWLPSPTGRF